MTTIAYSKGVLAGDTRESDGDVIFPDRVRKVFRLKDGSLFAASGAAEQCEMVLRQLKDGKTVEDKWPKLTAANALLVRPNGKVFFFEGNLWRKLNAPFHAIGSGTVAALAAMMAGANAVKAVKIAMKLDAYTGGRVQTVSLKRRRSK